MRKILQKGQKEFDLCPKKMQARQETIIDLYRSIFGRSSLPDHQSYITLCAQCGNSRGKVKKGSEFETVVNEKLVKESQFYGIEGNPEIHKLNKGLKTSAKWFYGDFLDMVQEVAANDLSFRPGIINYDSIHFPTTDPDYFIRLLKVVMKMNWTDVLVLGNFVLLAHGREVSYENILDSFVDSAHSKIVFSTDFFSLYPHVYLYDGTGKKSATKMGTIAFYNKG